MEEEGVIKFQLHWQASSAPAPDLIRELEAWRSRVRAIGGIGANPRRYGGIGFGNLSHRCAEGFWITGTQTGELASLGPQHYSLVERWDIGANTVYASGPVAPSSESLSHAALYDLRRDIHWVFHAHLPELWRRAAELDLPRTPADIAYGTPAMALAVQEIARHARLPLLLSMTGHEDGILVAGQQADECGQALLRAIARAPAI
ncbi:class II aldolase/adducin family protein [Acidithiobacillus sp. AMEEHan]|uniref:class II aldolase/adducin family protein n=1 Tax=Acidithiobacillus sp. AMEEHan TaxID=2994951 RepID=UPI0027E3ED6B|nr:class II aldolase/adducin family protein [Acidithiobacillus sp. AMEEHan]